MVLKRFVKLEEMFNTLVRSRVSYSTINVLEVTEVTKVAPGALVWRGILDKNVIGSYHQVHYIEFACILSYRPGGGGGVHP